MLKNTVFNIIKNQKLLLIICILLLIIGGIAVTFNLMYSLAFFAILLMAVILVYFPKLIIIYLVVIYENFFYLIDIENIPYFFSGAQMMGIAACVLCILFIKNIITKKYIFKFEATFFVIIIFVASIVAYYKYGQSFIESIYSGYLYFAILAYFFLREIYKGKEASEKMINYLILLGTILSVMFIAQYVLFGRFDFLKVTYSLRYDDIRLHEATSLIPFTVVMVFNRLICSGKKRFYLLISFLIQLYCLISVAKSRTVIIGIFISFIVIMILQKKIKFKIIITVFVIMALCFSFLMIMDIVSLEFFTSTVDEIRTSGGTVGIRYEATEYFRGLIQQNPLLGTGIINIDVDKAYFVSGLKNDYFFVDVGVIGYTTMLGILGLIGAILLLLKCTIISIRIYKKDKNIIFPIALMIMQASIMLTVFWLLGNLLYLTIVMTYLDNVYREQLSLEGEKYESINDITSTIHS